MDNMYASSHAYETEGKSLTTCETFQLVGFGLAHQIIFVALFAEVGYGRELFRAAEPIAGDAYVVGTAGVGVFLCLYMLDAAFWTRCYKFLAIVLATIGLALVLIALVLVQVYYSTLPFAAYFLGMPCVYFMIRRTGLAHVQLFRFLKTCSYPLMVGGIATVMGWVIWVAMTGSTFSEETRDEYASLFNCKVSFDNQCLSAAVRYFAPLCGGIFNVFFGFGCFSVAWGTTPEERAAGDAPEGATAGGSEEGSIKKKAKLHVVMRLLLISLVLIAAGALAHNNVQGSSPAAAYAALFLSLAGLIVLSSVAAHIVGAESLREKIRNTPLARSIISSIASSDVFKAIMLLGGWFPLGVFFTLTAFKQRLRVAIWLKPGKDEYISTEGTLVVRRSDTFTAAAQGVWDQLRKWEWTMVLTKLIWVGIVINVLSITSSLLPVFVAWIRRAVIAASFPVWAVVLIVTFVGFILFMLPPVPGAGIYYMAPVILTQVMEFSVAIAVSIGVSFFLKLAALVIQQKVIGEGLGSLVSVRSLARVNSVHTRAVREVLSAPGWTRGKVAILIGGPDWPTSVLTGILRLNVFSMMLGTTPIIVIIAAFVVNGAYLTVREANETTGIIYNISLAVALSVGIGSQLGALHYIVTTVEKKRADLEAEPNDPEVAARDEEKEKEALELREATRWKGNEEFGLAPAPVFVKVNILAGVVVQVGLCYILGIWPTVVFAAFTYADTIEDRLGGDWTRIATSQGRWILVTWVASWLCLFVYQTWAKHRVGALTRASMSKAYKGGTAKNSSSATENAP